MKFSYVAYLDVIDEVNKSALDKNDISVSDHVIRESILAKMFISPPTVDPPPPSLSHQVQLTKGYHQ